MPRAMFEDVIRYLHHAAALGADCDLTDAQLLDRFLSLREETAFTFLVQRHGPMILGVGRRVLGDAHEAEDVLQATFLILARRTRAIGGKRSLGGWLHGVAHHVALKAKATLAARRKRESEARTMPSARPVDELTCQELRAALDDAIASLPEKYHAPVVLCDLEGKSYDQAAQELGCPKTTLARRLTQARELLRKKLVHRGIGLSAAALATTLADVATASPMPAMLTIKTVKAAGLVAAGKSVVGCLSAGAIALAEEAMIVAKGKLVLMVMVVGLAVGGGWAGYSGFGERPREVSANNAQRAVANDQASIPEKKGTKTIAADDETVVILAGLVVDKQGKGMAEAEVEYRFWELTVRVATQSDGSFTLRIKDKPRLACSLWARSKDGAQLGCLFFGELANEPTEWNALRVVLKPGKRLEVLITDAAGQPVPDARVGVLSAYQIAGRTISDNQGRGLLLMPQDSPVEEVFAWQHGRGFDYRSFKGRDGKPLALPRTPIPLQLEGSQTIRLTLNDGDGRPIPNLQIRPWYFQKPGDSKIITFNGFQFFDEFNLKTDRTGVAVWDWFPKWQKREGVHLMANTKEYLRDPSLVLHAESGDAQTLTLNKLERLRGKVSYPDGTSATRILIRASGMSEARNFTVETRTGADGKYEMLVATDCNYVVVVSDRKWAAQAHTGFAVSTKAPTDAKDFVLRPATTITGRVTQGKDKTPYPEQEVILQQVGNPLLSIQKAKGPFRLRGLSEQEKNKYVTPFLKFTSITDKEGNYEFHVGPGQFQLRWPSLFTPVKITVTDQAKLEYSFNVPLGRLTGDVVTGTPAKPVAGVTLLGIYRVSTGFLSRFEATTDVQGRFAAECLRYPMLLGARSADGKLAGAVDVGVGPARVKVLLTPVAQAHGRLVAQDTGAPLPNRKIMCCVKVILENGKKSSFRTAFENTALTDGSGRFRLTNLIAGQDYSVVVNLESKGKYTLPLRQFIAAPGETLNIGDVKLPPMPGMAPPPTIAELRRAAFNFNGTPLERFANACRDAHLGKLRVLVIFAEPENAAAKQLFEAASDRTELGDAPDDFRRLWVRTDADRLPAAQALAKKLRVDLQAGGNPLLVVADELGEPRTLKKIEELQSKEKLDAVRLRQFLQAEAPKRLDANKLLADALVQAKKENKRVLVQETATWCGPCWSLSRILDKNRDIWEKDYLWLKVDHRWTGARDVIKRLRDKAVSGIPWTAILDADGKVLVRCTDKDAGKIDFSGEDRAVTQLVPMLRSTSQRLREADIGRLIDALKKGDAP